MHSAPRLSSSIALVAAVGLLVGDVAAAEPSVDECVAAYESAQRDRNAGELRASLEHLRTCVQDTCPAVVRGDCATWLGEVEASLPSVAIGVVDTAGNAVAGAALRVDGKEASAWQNGRSFALDPGPHTLQAAAPGYAPLSQRIVVLEGQRNQSTVLRLAAVGTGSPPTPPTSPMATGGSTPWGAIVLGGLAGLGLAGFGGFGVAAIATESGLESDCAPGCSESEVDGVRTLRLASGISLGVGAAAAAGFVIVLATSGESEPTTAARLGVWSTGEAGGARVVFPF